LPITRLLQVILKGESIDLLGRQQAYPSQAVYPKLKGVERLFRSNTKEIWLIAG
jgi:hypothetical protein